MRPSRKSAGSSSSTPPDSPIEALLIRPALGIAPSAGAERVIPRSTGLLLAADNDRGCVQTGLAAGRALSGQLEDHLLDLGARRIVRLREARHHWRGDLAHEGEVLLGTVELHGDTDLLLSHVLQAGVAKDSGHVAARSAPEQAGRAGARRG